MDRGRGLAGRGTAVETVNRGPGLLHCGRGLQLSRALLRPGMQPRVRAAATCSHACVLINASISAGRAMKMMNRCDLDFDECAFRTVAIWTRNKKTATVQIVAGSADRNCSAEMKFWANTVVGKTRRKKTPRTMHGASVSNTFCGTDSSKSALQ